MHRKFLTLAAILAVAATCVSINPAVAQGKKATKVAKKATKVAKKAIKPAKPAKVVKIRKGGKGKMYTPPPP